MTLCCRRNVSSQYLGHFGGQIACIRFRLIHVCRQRFSCRTHQNSPCGPRDLFGCGDGVFVSTCLRISRMHKSRERPAGKPNKGIFVNPGSFLLPCRIQTCSKKRSASSIPDLRFQFTNSIIFNHMARLRPEHSAVERLRLEP